MRGVSPFTPASEAALDDNGFLLFKVGRLVWFESKGLTASRATLEQLYGFHSPNKISNDSQMVVIIS